MIIGDSSCQSVFSQLHGSLKPAGSTSDPAAALACMFRAAIFLRLGSALLLTLRVRAIRFMMAVPVVDWDPSRASLAIPCRFHVRRRLAGVSYKVQEDGKGRRKKGYKVKLWKKIQVEEDGISNRHPYTAFISPLTLKALPKQSGEYLLKVVIRRYENRHHHDQQPPGGRLG